MCKRVAAQIEEAVLEADVFRIIRLAEHRQRQLLRLAQHLGVVDAHFDLAGRQFRVHRFRRARDHLAVDAHDAFGAQPLEQRETPPSRGSRPAG